MRRDTNVDLNTIESWECGMPKDLSFLRAYIDCSARCTDHVTWGEKVRQRSINTPIRLSISTRVKPGGGGGTEEEGGGGIRAE